MGRIAPPRQAPRPAGTKSAVQRSLMDYPDLGPARHHIGNGLSSLGSHDGQPYQPYPEFEPRPDPRRDGDGSLGNPYKSRAIAAQAARTGRGPASDPGVYSPAARKGDLLDTASRALLDQVSQVRPDLDTWTGGPGGRNAANLTRLLQNPARAAEIADGTREVFGRLDPAGQKTMRSVLGVLSREGGSELASLSTAANTLGGDGAEHRVDRAD